MKDSFIHRALFSQAASIIKIGRNRPLVADDALPLPEHISPRSSRAKILDADTTNFSSFIWRVFLGTGKPARMLMTLALVRIAIALSTPLLLKALLELLPSASLSEAIPVGMFLLAVALGTMGMVGAIVTQHFYFNALQAFAIIVNGINRRVVEQALKLRHSARSKMNTGDLVNHLSSDSDAIGETSFFLPEAMSAVVDTVAAIIMLSVFIGWGAGVAVLTLIILSPLTILVSKRYRHLDHHVMELRDERVTLMSQILQGIRVVKFQAWEPSVHEEVAQVRKREIHTRVRIVVTDAISTALFISSTTIVAFTGFGSFVMLGGELTAPIVFASIALFAMLEDPFGMISHILANMQHARVATGRLDKFFKASVREEDDRPLSDPHISVGVRANGVNMTYPSAAEPALSDISLDIEAGSSVAIVGAVGSGKSTLLRSLAGLHHLSDGNVANTNIPDSVRPRASYVPQEAFIMNASVEDNILFGDTDELESNAELNGVVARVIHDCALTQDLEAMPTGLSTEIGERGVNLSGGQKQRVSLARAAFNDPGIVFLDDPLSAVDADTEETLVNRLIFGRWSSITRIIVTHRLAHLKRFDRVVVLDQGRIVADGHFDSIKDFIPAEAEYSEFDKSPEPSVVAEASHSTVHDAAFDTSADAAQEAHREGTRITDDEDRDTGAVRLDVYWGYVRAMIGEHPVLAPIILVGLIGTAAAITVFPILQTSWIGYWTDISSGVANDTYTGIASFWHSVVTWLGIDVSDPLFAVSIYGLLGTLVLTGWIGERLLWLYRSAAAGRLIHNQALAGVLAAPLRFFDSTPMGRVLNRFSRDMEGVDDHLSWNWEQSFKSLSQTVGSLLLILTVLPLVLVVLVPVLVVYYKLQKDYRTAAREAKRLESIARSPRYAHFKELVTGLDVIHGFGRERFFMESFYSILGDFQRQFWTSIILNRWFSVRIPIISGLVSVATSVGIVFLAHSGDISAGLAGVVLTYALSFWWSLNWAVRAFSEVESRMTSVERLRAYGNLEKEPSYTNHSPLADEKDWPTLGAVEIKDLTVRYAPHLPQVLKGVSFSVNAKSKVGIIGRTGSGKSTLFQTLFRFIEPESGSVKIDGVDITRIPLQRLRRNIAIIPQDPTLFIGTIRSNLDRFDESSDEEIWTALRRVRLYDHVQRMPGMLESEVVEGGLNFSQGQRQLLCLARAILLEAKVIVLDEATASVDLETDSLIQQTIRDEFGDVTVLIIAHRLDTVADADMIVELSDGRVVEKV